MKRARLIVKEIRISKQGEVNFFQVRLPKNVLRIIGIETDTLIISALPPETESIPPRGGKPDGTTGKEVDRRPFLKWNSQSNPIIGKLKLQSMDRINIFFEAWIPFLFLNDSIPDMSYGLFTKSPYSINQKSLPKKMSIPCSNLLINGVFTDSIGARRGADMNYKVKVFVWVETTEDAKGVVYDFQQQSETKR